jgi:tetratricopeptide (TPR) repeat protein
MRYNRRMLRATSVAVLVMTGAALAVPPGMDGAAHAQAKTDFDAAKKHYLSGKSAMAAHDYDLAIREYILAYDITKDAALFKQIGQAYEAQGKKVEAAVYYRRYLNEAKGSGGDGDEMRGRIAALEGETKGQAPTSAVVAPTSTLSASPSPSGAGGPGSATMPPEPPKLPPPESPTAAPPDMQLSQPGLPTYADEGVRWQRTAAWISVGLAAAGVTAGAVLAASAASREDDLTQLINYRDPTSGQPRAFSGTTKDDYLAKIDEGNRLSNFATAAFIGAGVFAAAAVTFFVLDATRTVPRGERAERLSMHPYLDWNGGGLQAAWEF